MGRDGPTATPIEIDGTPGVVMIGSSRSIDHVHPESAGDPTTIENLQTLCVACNSAKGARVGLVGAGAGGDIGGVSP